MFSKNNFNENNFNKDFSIMTVWSLFNMNIWALQIRFTLKKIGILQQVHWSKYYIWIL